MKTQNGFMYVYLIEFFSRKKKLTYELFSSSYESLSANARIDLVCKLNSAECHNEKMYDKINLGMMCNAIYIMPMAKEKE
jgi:hypothetical protein